MRLAANTTSRFKAEEVKDEKRFSRSSLVVVLFAATLLLLGIGFRVYRFTLPTEGWSFRPDFFKQGLIFDQNLMAVPSAFQKGDLLLEVAGENILQVFAFQKTLEKPEVYRVGNIISYKVQRGDKILSLETPLYHWTTEGISKAFAQIFLNRVFHFSPFLLLQLALASFVFVKRPDNRAAQILLLMFATNLASGLNWVVSGFSPADMFDPLAREATDWLAASINPILLIPLFVHLALIFPKPKWGFDKTWWPLVLLYAPPLVLTLLWKARFIPAIADYVVPFYFLVMLIAYIHSLLTIKEPVLRAQMKWLAYAGAIWAVGGLISVSNDFWSWLPSFVSEHLNWVPVELLWVVCLCIAILRYRLFDIDVIINRTLVYGTLSFGVVGLYLGLVTGSSYLLQTQSNIAVFLVAAIVILFLLKPFHHLLQQNVNRFIPVTPASFITPAASSEFTPTNVRAENISTSEEKKRDRSPRIVIIFAIALLCFSVVQKAYRLTLPTEGWSSITNFESDEPILEKNLLGVPSELQAGDKVIAVNGIPILEIQEQAIRGKTTLLESHQAGQTVRYTVLRGDEELEVNVPLYAGSSLSVWTILKEFFGGNHVSDFMLWLAILLVSFVFWKRPNHLTAQLFFLQIACTLAPGISWTISPLSVADSLTPLTFYLAGFFSHWIHLLLLQPLGLHVILSFPKPHPVLQNPWTLPLLYGLPLVILVLALSGVSFSSPFFIVALYNLLGIIVVVGMFFRKWDAVATAQVRWFGFGFAVSNLGTLMFGLWAARLLPDHLLLFSEAFPYNLVFLVCTSVAILRYRLFDINVILNRTLVYGGLTAGVVGLYALVVGGVGRLVHVQNNVLLSLLATGLIAVAFNPLRVRLQRAANRLLYGDRDDPYQVLSKLSERMEGTVEPSKLLPTMTETIATTLKLPYAAIALGQNGNMQIVASHGTPKSENIALPLAYQGETVGELRLEPRAGETFKATELNLLKTIAQQASVAAHTVKQHLDLQNSREALVTAREEERLRIRRDLHDGLGPELASLTLKLDATRNLLKHDTDKAETLLVELKHQTQDAVASIRRLVYALRPPALDELGLEGALREQVRSYDHTVNIELKTVGDLTNLPAAVEVACYRITQEALTNVVRHSKAKNCKIILCAADRLFIDVQDDGSGLSEHYRPGVGLRSMRERAEELGGTFTLTSSEKGTRLLATLPLTTETRDRKENAD
jgi:signal transduction histidine kinase